MFFSPPCGGWCLNKHISDRFSVCMGSVLENRVGEEVQTPPNPLA